MLTHLYSSQTPAPRPFAFFGWCQPFQPLGCSLERFLDFHGYWTVCLASSLLVWCLHFLVNHRLAGEFKRISLTEALVLCFYGLGLDCLPPQELASMLRSFTSCLYAMLWSFVLLYLLLFLSRLGKMWSKKRKNCPGWVWYSSGWRFKSSNPAIACFSWVALEVHLSLHKESATAWAWVRSQDKRRWAWSHHGSWGHLMLWMEIHVLMAQGWTWDNPEHCYQ